MKQLPRFMYVLNKLSRPCRKCKRVRPVLWLDCEIVMYGANKLKCFRCAFPLTTRGLK